MNPAQLQRALAAFTAADKNADGRIDSQEAVTLVTNLFPSPEVRSSRYFNLASHEYIYMQLKQCCLTLSCTHTILTESLLQDGDKAAAFKRKLNLMLKNRDRELKGFEPTELLAVYAQLLREHQ